MSKSKANATTFRKGKPKTGGRTLGVPNKSTKVLNEAFLIAAENAGNKRGKHGVVSYLTWVAEKPAIFMPALTRRIPQQVETKEVSPEQVVCRTSAEIRQKLIKRGRVPVHMIHPALTDEADETEETDGTDKTKPDKTDDNSGEQQH
jgi:hypothetical protein